MNKKTKLIDKISRKYPCRADDLLNLYNYLGNLTLYPAIYVHGLNGTGKTAVISELLRSLRNAHPVFINCLNCYTSKLLFETIIDGLVDHELSESDNYASYAKCDNASDFVAALDGISGDKPQIIMFDRAEKLRDMDANILPLLLKLSEITRFEVTCLFVSALPFNKMIPSNGCFSEPILHYWPQYSKQEIQQILCSKYDIFKELICRRINNSSNLSAEQKKERLDIVEDRVSPQFLDDYLNICLMTFFRTCRDFIELYEVCKDCFPAYLEPVLDGSIEAGDSTRLYSNISSTLKDALNLAYRDLSDVLKDLGITNQNDQAAAAIAKPNSSTPDMIELPYFGKFMLIAAFLASHNDAKSDKRLFVKNHGKQKKRLQNVQASAKVSERLATQLGPKSFTIDRLFAIFYAIIDENVKLSDKLTTQVASLVKLKLLVYVSGESNLMDGSARLQCTVSLDFIYKIGKSVNFNVRQYLCDFM